MPRGRVRRQFWLPAVALSLMTLIAACGNGSQGGSDEAGNNDDASSESGDENATGASGLDRPIVFADYNWDGPLFHNRIAQFILEEGYGYETDTLPGETIPLFQGQIDGDIDVSMEIWLDQMPPFEPAVEDGDIVDLGGNFDGGTQGWYVPTYVIEGDEERGIEPMAPDLTHVDQLPEYKDLFADPAEPGMGRIYDGPAGWELEKINEVKVKAYGLDEHYNRFLSGSGPALHTSLISAYEEGEPWLGFEWVPNWVTGLYDLTKLEEPEHTEECWAEVQQAVEDGSTPEQACAWPVSDVNIAVSDDFAEAAPDVTEFLRNYETTLEQNDAALAHMAENDVGHQEAAIWYLNEYPDTWTEWVPEDVAEGVQTALDEQ